MSPVKIVDTLMNRVKSQTLIVLLVLVCIQESVSQNCVRVDTSEGRVTLRHGQSACAPLLGGETKATDQGKRFVICSYGYVFMQSCPGVLRFHAALGICQWPEFSDCNIHGPTTDGTRSTTSITRMSPSTRLPTTETTTRSRETSLLTTLFSTAISTTASTTAAATTASLKTASATSTTASTTAAATTASPTTASTTATSTTATIAAAATKASPATKPTQATPIKTTPTASPTTKPTQATPIKTTLTASQTTISPTTASATTIWPTTASPTTISPTASPTTISPTTASPITIWPTTASPTTISPTTASPTTISLTTASPATISITKASPPTYLTTSPTTTSKTATSPTKALPPTYLTTSLTTSPVTTLLTTASSAVHTTKSPTYLTTQEISNRQTTTTTINTNKTTVELTTDHLAYITRTTEIPYGANTPRETKTPHIKTTTTVTAPINTTSDTTASFRASTKTPLIAHSTTASSSSTSTVNNRTPSDLNTVRPDDSEYVDPCNWETCQPPQCFCYGASPNISLEDTPMFLLLTYDGPMMSELFNSYYEMMMVDNGNRLFNPNGCPFRSTVFLAGDGTDYRAVETLASAGHEIASGTLTEALPIGDLDADYNDTVKEIDGLRKKVLQETKSQELHDSLVGFRAPSLRTAQDIQFQVLKDNQFLYDSSISNIEIYSARSPVWPYTLDFGVVQCPNPPCPSRNYPGLWEVPVNSWLGEDGQSCSYVDSCSVGANVFTAEENDWYNLFKNNFEAHFYPAKAPMHISMRTSTPTENLQLEQAMVRWLEDTLSSYNNVWLVTHQMVIDWMRNPLTNSQMLAQKWGCLS